MSNLDNATERRVLGVFAKEPIAGQVKTRLAHGSSTSWAQKVASAFLADSLQSLADVEATRVIAYAPASAQNYFSAWQDTGYELFCQAEGSLGQRLQHFFDYQKDRGYTHVVVVGADSPTLPVSYVEHAFAALKSHDVVVGPSFDGGYYLIGSGITHVPLFEDIPWSTAAVLEKTIERLKQAGASLALLPPWYDVDTVEDWAMLRGHVLAMCQAGFDPGVPRTMQLIEEEPS